jgi:hypothetical protein
VSAGGIFGKLVRVSSLAIGLGFLVAPASAADAGLAMLSSLTSGSWEIRVRGEEGASRICVRNGRELIQIRHRRNTCTTQVLEDGASNVTVEYSCPGNGFGRTSIRRETAQLVQINTQGFEGGVPFHFNAEARRVGGC